MPVNPLGSNGRSTPLPPTKKARNLLPCGKTEEKNNKSDATPIWGVPQMEILLSKWWFRGVPCAKQGQHPTIGLPVGLSDPEALKAKPWLWKPRREEGSPSQGNWGLRWTWGFQLLMSGVAPPSQKSQHRDFPQPCAEASSAETMQNAIALSRYRAIARHFLRPPTRARGASAHRRDFKPRRKRRLAAGDSSWALFILVQGLARSK